MLRSFRRRLLLLLKAFDQDDNGGEDDDEDEESDERQHFRITHDGASPGAFITAVVTVLGIVANTVLRDAASAVALKRRRLGALEQLGNHRVNAPRFDFEAYVILHFFVVCLLIKFVAVTSLKDRDAGTGEFSRDAEAIAVVSADDESTRLSGHRADFHRRRRVSILGDCNWGFWNTAIDKADLFIFDISMKSRQLMCDEKVMW